MRNKVSWIPTNYPAQEIKSISTQPHKCDDVILERLPGTLTSRYWRIRVDQIYCGELFSPPHGCTQFFMSDSGRVRSFNFGVSVDYHHLADQSYAVCFRRARGVCRISYTPTEEQESFWLSRNPTATAYASAGESSCLADFLIIPRGTNGGAGSQCTVSLHVLTSNF